MPEAEQLRRRGEVMTDALTTRGLFLSSALECLRRLQGEDAVRAAVSDARIGDSRFAMRKYPLKMFNDLRSVIGERIAPTVGSLEEGIARIGAFAVEMSFESLPGRTMMALAGRDPHRLSSAAPKGYALAFDDGAQRSYEKLGETEGVFRFRNCLLGPCHQVGVFRTALKAACGVDVRVRIDQPSLADYDVHISW